jgi:hypothetical protein
MNMPPMNKPQKPPQNGTSYAPELDAIPGIVESNDFFISVIAFADNTEVLHFEASSGKLLDRDFRRRVVSEDGYDGVGIFHRMFLNGELDRVWAR